MENLNELVAIVNRIKIQRIEIMGKGRTQYSKLMKRLYDGIANEEFVSDADAALAIYGPDYVPNNFARLKIKLTNKLINTLFFINVSDYQFTNIQEAYFDAEKIRGAIKILLGRGAKKTGIKLAEKLIKKSLKYELTEVALELARILRRHYRTHNLNVTKEKIYHAIVVNQLKILTAEIEVENYYEIIRKEITLSKLSRSEMIQLTTNYANKISRIFPKLESYKLGQFSHMFFVLEHEITKDYEKSAKACKTAIQYFESKKELASKEVISMFYINLLAAYIPLKRFREGEKIAERIFGSITEGVINWFITLDYYFLLSLHTGNYEKAADIFAQATNHKLFKNLSAEYSELWRVYEAYLEYLKQAGILKKEDKKPFRIGKFMNEVPIYSRDKKGVNVSILIIQILFLVAQGKEFKVIDRVESLRVYVHTYLRNDDSLRSNCFIKMLLKMVKSNFHRNGTIRRTESLHKKLLETPISAKGHSQYVEIIPYENLWEMSLTFLGNRAF